MGFWGKIFGSTKVVEKGLDTVNTMVDKAGSFIDNAFFTDQEKSNANLKLHDFRMKMFELVQKYNSDGKSLTRRLIVLGFAGSYLLALWLGVIFEKLTESTVKKIGEEIIVIRESDIFFAMVDKLEWHVTLMFYFYFGYYGVKQVGTGMLKAIQYLRQKKNTTVINNDDSNNDSSNNSSTGGNNFIYRPK